MPPQTIHPALPILACVLRSGRAARSQDRMTGIPECLLVRRRKEHPSGKQPQAWCQRLAPANNKNIFLNTGNRTPATVNYGQGHRASAIPDAHQPASRSAPKGPH
ncbi:hypothetical protein LH435_08270 [Laribacter hongkongensis]|uniref:hypothetical protein n=1 Tax=Laribacter hongkongensis TaxID=168471 RepID=UPI001EFEAC6D|nr:hypothetical protein [Laribacter hongkongensis]MCG8994389.1 hypothetical protein [Laribacter hongkongensis]MCG9011818.1 hypothetical protein [Laribacter hongkongensis]MCG9022951.1 hypothetical protein [Laribacter hongkongensis]MCG9046571.1 hypothetical protein [Laribacter hongkongensis]MCG9074007.1 hypothetical protein [Laribacter hongkongensis]